MKNLLGKKEFQQLKEIEMIQESMDFSNKIGWSDSLLGRITNKLFSFVAKQAQMMILRKLKVRLEDQYMAGLLIAMAQANEQIEQTTKSNVADIQISLQNKSDENDVIDQPNAQEKDGKIIITFQLDDKKREDYKTLITPIEESTWKIGDKVNEQLEDITEEFEVVSTSASQKNTKTFVVHVLVNDDQNLALGTGEEKEEKEVMAIGAGKKYELLKVVDVENQIEEVASFLSLYKKDCVKDYEYPMMMKIYDIINDEKEKIKTIVQYIEKVPSDNIPEEVSDYVDKKDKYIEQANKLNQLSTNLKSRIDELEKKEISDEEFNKVIENELQNALPQASSKYTNSSVDELNVELAKIRKEQGEKSGKNPEYIEISKELEKRKKKSKEKFIENRDAYTQEAKDIISNLEKKSLVEDDKKRLQKLKTILGQLSGDQGQTAWKLFKKAVHAMDKSYEFINESRYYNFLLDKIFEEIDIFIEKNSEQLFENPEQLEQLYEKNIAGFSVSKTNIKSVMKQYENSSKKQDIKKVVDLYGDIDYGKIDAESMIKKFRENADLRNTAKVSVNKEALKEVALRASWMYNAEKYKSQRNSHYSRVNFTTTDSDQTKLENTWLKFVSQVKQTYAPFLNDENGNFPPDLDPIALINSDKSFREKFDQYAATKPDVEYSEINGDADNKTGNDTLKNMKLNGDSIPKNGYGILIFNTSDNVHKNLGMIIRKSEINGTMSKKLQVHKFVGLINYQGILDGINEVKDDKKLKDLIDKNNYSGIEKIKENVEDLDLQSKLITLYDQFRPSARFKKSGNIKETTELATFFITSQNLKGGTNKKTAIQVNSYLDSSGNIQSYVSEIEKAKTIRKPIPITKITDNKDDYRFSFYVTQAAEITPENKDYYVTKVSDDEEIKKTKYFIENPEAIDKVSKLLSEK